MADFIKVADVNEIEEGTMMQVEVDGELICLAKVDGVVCALSNNCTHIGGPLNKGELQGYEVTCPWHGAQFDVRTGKVLCGPAQQDVPIYPVKLEGESVFISLPDEE